MPEIYDEVRKWRRDRNITDSGACVKKLLEELGECMGEDIRTQGGESHGLEIGDIFFTLIVYADIHGFRAEECLARAMDKNRNRKGALNENGVFIKEGDRQGAN